VCSFRDLLFVLVLGKDLISLSSNGHSHSFFLGLGFLDFAHLLSLSLHRSYVFSFFSCFLSISHCFLSFLFLLFFSFDSSLNFFLSSNSDFFCFLFKSSHHRSLLLFELILHSSLFLACFILHCSLFLVKCLFHFFLIFIELRFQFQR